MPNGETFLRVAMRSHVVALSVGLVVFSLPVAASADDAPAEEQASPAAVPPPTVATPPVEQRAEAGKTDVEKPADDHRFELGARIGVMLPGEISPVNWFRTEASLAPTFSLDPSFVVHPNFAIGVYVQATPFSFDRMSGSKTIGSGSGFWLSAGASAKGRIAIRDVAILRGGLTFGRNFVSYSGETSEGGSEFELSGGGFSAGPVIDGVYRVSPKVGVSAQLGFLSQFSGSATVKGYPTNLTAEGEERDFRFKPIFFFTVGPELFL